MNSFSYFRVNQFPVNSTYRQGTLVLLGLTTWIESTLRRHFESTLLHIPSWLIVRHSFDFPKNNKDKLPLLLLLLLL